ncbi:MAG: hypothetical protein Q8N18_16365 [Opitutaceae bacterium]|nr:hypothetical protein [Opitutaceae bacterium]
MKTVRACAFGLSLGWAMLPASATTLTTIGVAYTQDFNSLATTGSSSVLPTGWAFNETGTSANTTYGTGTGSSTTGDTYSFGNSADRAFGTLLSGTLVPTIGASFINNTGATISSITISYTGEQWRLGATGREDRLEFSYSTNATSLTSGSWIDDASLNFIAPVTAGTVGLLDGNLSANRTAISGTITGLSISNGSEFWLRWSDFNATGSDDGLGIDDFSLTPYATAVRHNAPDGLSALVPFALVLALLATRRRVCAG